MGCRAGPSQIRLDTQLLLAGENTNRAMYTPPFGVAVDRTTNDCDPDDANSPCALFPDQPDGFLEHPGRNSILFGDMHVQSFRRDDPTA